MSLNSSSLYFFVTLFTFFFGQILAHYDSNDDNNGYDYSHANATVFRGFFQRSFPCIRVLQFFVILNWNLRSMAIGALEIWVMPRISSMWPWPTRMIEGFWASQVVLGPSNYSIGPFYTFIDYVIWHAFAGLSCYIYKVIMCGLLVHSSNEQGEGLMRL